MNLQSVFEELNKLYENVEEPVEEQEVVEQEEAAEELTEAVEDEAPVEEPEEAAELNLVLECAKCGALVIKPEADVAVDEESDLVNVEDACQYCEATEGYKIIGTLAPYGTEEEIEVVEEEEPEAEDEVVEEGLLDLDVPVSVDVKADNNTVSVGSLGA